MAPIGSSSFEMLEPIAAPRASTDKTAVPSSAIVVYAIPAISTGELTRPAYPSEALSAHAGSCEVFVTITVDTSGTVTDVVPSWQRMNIPGRFSGEFLAAVRATVLTWKFEPARNEYWRKKADGNLAYMYAETVPAKTDIKFTFDASGMVR